MARLQNLPLDNPNINIEQAIRESGFARRSPVFLERKGIPRHWPSGTLIPAPFVATRSCHENAAAEGTDGRIPVRAKYDHPP